MDSALTHKIERIAGAKRLTIKLISQLDVDCLAELEAQIASGVGRIELEMKEVTLVDIDVMRFLVKCQARGISGSRLLRLHKRLDVSRTG
jgi:hypothetical protein